MVRALCIHGHFYQPQRENPWSDAIDLQESAKPYHDWNERIKAECYGPNSAVNNYSKMSFNFGPTLLSWMDKKAPELVRAIHEADQESRKRFSGHGSAIAQVYNHIIMPLANARDKRTEILWGLYEFEFRFKRKPEGMWLPETAVDLESLDLMAGEGIKLTILSPHQAQRIRKSGGETWDEVERGRIDPTRAYEIHLPSGRLMAIFFYDGPISHAVAFDGLLKNGADFAKRLGEGFSKDRDWPQLVHIATDGETYGHHHKRGEVALAEALQLIESDQTLALTNYGEFLDKFPPTHEVQILEQTSWSCSHGIDRWRKECGCRSGEEKKWHQNWKTPLRAALDWLRDELAPRFESEAKTTLKDPWMARDSYIQVLLDRSSESHDRFLHHHQNRDLNEEEKKRTLKLLEMERQALLMYTSCGWFYDELSGIETIQIIQNAGRAIQLARDVLGEDFGPRFKEKLSEANGNLPNFQDGGVIYERYVMNDKSNSGGRL